MEERFLLAEFGEEYAAYQRDAEFHRFRLLVRGRSELAHQSHVSSRSGLRNALPAIHKHAHLQGEKRHKIPQDTTELPSNSLVGRKYSAPRTRKVNERRTYHRDYWQICRRWQPCWRGNDWFARRPGTAGSRRWLEDMGTQHADGGIHSSSIASMTKPVTSTAALMLLEEGRFALNDPIALGAGFSPDACPALVDKARLIRLIRQQSD